MPSLADKKKLIAAITVGVVALVGLLLYYEYGPGGGLRELQASQRAVREAKSWRSETRIPLDTSSSMVSRARDIVCPTDFVDSYAEAGNLAVVHRRALIHGLAYNQRADGTWMNSLGFSLKLNEYGKGPVADGIFLYPGLKRLEYGGAVRRGKRAHTEHGSCLWWHIYIDSEEEPQYSACIDGFNHLPLEVRFSRSGNEYSYWDWNRTTLIPPVVTAEAAPY